MEASLFRFVTISPLNGQTHTWDDCCEINNASHVAFAKEVSDRQLNHLRSLSQQELAQVLGTEGCTPTGRARTILLDERIEKPGHLLTKDDIDLAVRECYDDICHGHFSPIYVDAVIEGIWDRTVEDAVTKGEGIQEGVEQLLWLTSRVVKGQACRECGEGIENGGHSSSDFTVMALEELEQTSKDMGLEWRLSDKGRFMLDKLITIFESDYGKIRHLAETLDPAIRYRGYEELETMWCDEYPECRCWDENRVEYHDHGCELSEL